MKKLVAALLALVLLLLCGCGAAEAPETTVDPTSEPVEAAVNQNEVYILYTNDVHCAIDANLGYAGLSLVKQTLLSQGKTVLLADAGDAVQGEVVGTLSKGEYIIDIMNGLGYDVAVPGNHEFDYGMDRLFELTGMAQFPYVSSNFCNADGSMVFAPYVILDAGVKIAFVGVTTPDTLVSSDPTHFMNEKGEYIYNFCQDESGEKLYSAVQTAVDAARAEGADYVIALAHLGIEMECSPWTSSELIVNTDGIDAVLDGHSHSVLEQELVKNKSGSQVILTSTGTKLNNIGCLVIDSNGRLSSGLISDNDIGQLVADVNAENAALSDKVVAHTDVDLCITDPATGFRMVRSNETNLGDLCADAYRAATGADIAIINGGGIRSDIPAGDITYGQIINVHPFGNMACVVEATGQEILDALELSASALPGEFGGFLQVSGISFVIDLRVDSHVVTDEESQFVCVDGTRRVKNVKVDGKPIDPEATYTLACHDFKLKKCGDGYNMFCDNVFLQDCVMLDNQVLINYIVDKLDGVVGEEYSDPYGQGRIVIKGA